MQLSVMNKLYDGRTENDWNDELIPQERWMRRHALSAFSMLEVPDTFLDVGCGTGIVVKTVRSLGSSGFGIDQLVNPDIDEESIYTIFVHANLVDKFSLLKPVNMVWCTEVAEHLDASAHATLCDTCADNLKEGRGNYLVFSSAYPGQGGNGHISERPAGYWKDQFAKRDRDWETHHDHRFQ